MAFQQRETERTSAFQRNRDLEMFLREINEDLWETEKKLLEQQVKEYPVVFVVGPLRSGTTLMMQWLANTGQFSYPTNILSRFYQAPIIGAKIQRLLTDEKYNFRNEILDFSSPVTYDSENGKTKGALSPNEFWYFWRRSLPFGELDYLPDEELLEKVDITTFRAEMMGIARVFDKPFALKGMICNYNLPFLDRVFDKVLFIYTKRDPYTNIESVLKARERQTGSARNWYSFRIPEYVELSRIEDPVKQAAGQVYYINRALEKGLGTIAEEKKMVVPYEEFCAEPRRFYGELVRKLRVQGYEISDVYNGPEAFRTTREGASDPAIIRAYREFEEKHGFENH
jgi:hypothetical protein